MCLRKLGTFKKTEFTNSKNVLYGHTYTTLSNVEWKVSCLEIIVKEPFIILFQPKRISLILKYIDNELLLSQIPVYFVVDCRSCMRKCTNDIARIKLIFMHINSHAYKLACI